jgi:hypothetical protein
MMRLAVIAVRTFANTSLGQVRTASKDFLALIASPSVEKETLEGSPPHLYASTRHPVPELENIVGGAGSQAPELLHSSPRPLIGATHVLSGQSPTDSFYPRGCRHLQISIGQSRLPAFLDDAPRQFQAYVRRYDGHSDAMRGPMRTPMYIGRAEPTHPPHPRATLAHACAAASIQCQPRRETLIFCAVWRCMVGGSASQVLSTYLRDIVSMARGHRVAAGIALLLCRARKPTPPEGYRLVPMRWDHSEMDASRRGQSRVFPIRAILDVRSRGGTACPNAASCSPTSPT